MKKYLLALFMMGVFFVLPGKQIFAENMVGSVDETKGTLVFSQDGVEIWEKVISSSYVDENGIEHQCESEPSTFEGIMSEDEYEKMSQEIKNSNEKTNEETNSAIETKYNKKEVREDGTNVATFDNRNSDASTTFSYSEEHKYTCTKSVSGSVDVKALKEALGVEYKDEFKKTVSYTVNVPARKGIKLWTAPKGTKYTWVQYWVSPSQAVACGEYTDWNSVIVTTVAM